MEEPDLTSMQGLVPTKELHQDLKPYVDKMRSVCARVKVS